VQSIVPSSSLRHSYPRCTSSVPDEVQAGAALARHGVHQHRLRGSRGMGGRKDPCDNATLSACDAVQGWRSSSSSVWRCPTLMLFSCSLSTDKAVHIKLDKNMEAQYPHSIRAQ